MPGSISAKGLFKAFPTPKGPLPVIEDLSLDIADGEFVALIGPSGCGKSTFLDILAGFERPDRGSLAVDGQPIVGPSRKRILIPQQTSVFPWQSARRNLTFVQDGVTEEEKKRLSLDYVNLVGLEGFDQTYPHQLSGGMLKRLELARALIVKPDILLMDEPFGPLDALTRIRLHAELLQILSVERHTTLLVTHDVHEALYLADRIVVFTPRPARIQCIVDVPFQHPRALVGGDIVRLKARILVELGLSPDGSFDRSKRPASGG
ncbi:MAG: ABC transporter ATP-binding protein [Gemmatimonadetes bacterium]|nr:ABC transporter ATP-binding protein [Gemmatimonadota bacterium]